MYANYLIGKKRQHGAKVTMSAAVGNNWDIFLYENAIKEAREAGVKMTVREVEKVRYYNKKPVYMKEFEITIN